MLCFSMSQYMLAGSSQLPAALMTRLAAIDGDDRYTGVKPQHSYVTRPPWHRRLDFFYSNKNNLV